MNYVSQDVMSKQSNIMTYLAKVVFRRFAFRDRCSARLARLSRKETRNSEIHLVGRCRLPV